MYPLIPFNHFIKKELKIDVSRDNMSIHPSRMCSRCKGKLSSMMNVKNFEFVEFSEHTAERCTVCSESKWNKPKDKTDDEERLSNAPALDIHLLEDSTSADSSGASASSFPAPNASPERVTSPGTNQKRPTSDEQSMSEVHNEQSLRHNADQISSASVQDYVMSATQDQLITTATQKELFSDKSKGKSASKSPVEDGSPNLATADRNDSGLTNVEQMKPSELQTHRSPVPSKEELTDDESQGENSSKCSHGVESPDQLTTQDTKNCSPSKCLSTALICDYAQGGKSLTPQELISEKAQGENALKSSAFEKGSGQLTSAEAIVSSKSQIKTSSMPIFKKPLPRGLQGEKGVVQLIPQQSQKPNDQRLGSSNQPTPSKSTGALQPKTSKDLHGCQLLVNIQPKGMIDASNGPVFILMNRVPGVVSKTTPTSKCVQPLHSLAPKPAQITDPERSSVNHTDTRKKNEKSSGKSVLGKTGSSPGKQIKSDLVLSQEGMKSKDLDDNPKVHSKEPVAKDGSDSIESSERKKLPAFERDEADISPGKGSKRGAEHSQEAENSKDVVDGKTPSKRSDNSLDHSITLAPKRQKMNDQTGAEDSPALEGSSEGAHEQNFSMVEPSSSSGVQSETQIAPSQNEPDKTKSFGSRGLILKCPTSNECNPIKLLSQKEGKKNNPDPDFLEQHAMQKSLEWNAQLKTANGAKSLSKEVSVVDEQKNNSEEPIFIKLNKKPKKKKKKKASKSECPPRKRKKPNDSLHCQVCKKRMKEDQLRSVNEKRRLSKLKSRVDSQSNRRLAATPMSSKSQEGDKQSSPNQLNSILLSNGLCLLRSTSNPSLWSWKRPETGKQQTDQKQTSVKVAKKGQSILQEATSVAGHAAAQGISKDAKSQWNIKGTSSCKNTSATMSPLQRYILPKIAPKPPEMTQQQLFLRQESANVYDTSKSFSILQQSTSVTGNVAHGILNGSKSCKNTFASVSPLPQDILPNVGLKYLQRERYMAELYHQRRFVEPEVAAILACSFCHLVPRLSFNTPCGHIFCTMCGKAWFKDTDSCFKCGAKVSAGDIEELSGVAGCAFKMLKLKCKNWQKGCNFTCRLVSDEIHMHESCCKSVLVKKPEVKRPKRLVSHQQYGRNSIRKLHPFLQSLYSFCEKSNERSADVLFCALKHELCKQRDYVSAKAVVGLWDVKAKKDKLKLRKLSKLKEMSDKQRGVQFAEESPACSRKEQQPTGKTSMKAKRKKMDPSEQSKPEDHSDKQSNVQYIEDKEIPNNEQLSHGKLSRKAKKPEQSRKKKDEERSRQLDAESISSEKRKGKSNKCDNKRSSEPQIRGKALKHGTGSAPEMLKSKGNTKKSSKEQPSQPKAKGKSTKARSTHTETVGKVKIISKEQPSSVKSKSKGVSTKLSTPNGSPAGKKYMDKDSKVGGKSKRKLKKHSGKNPRIGIRPKKKTKKSSPTDSLFDKNIKLKVVCMKLTPPGLRNKVLHKEDGEEKSSDSCAGTKYVPGSHPNMSSLDAERNSTINDDTDSGEMTVSMGSTVDAYLPNSSVI